MTARFTDSFDSFCPMCKQLMLQAESYRRSHKQGMAEVAFNVCWNCKDRGLCPQTFYGVHGEIIDMTDLEDPLVADRGVFIEAGYDPEDIPHNAHGRIAYCALCKEIQIWDVPTQRWRDPHEEIPDEYCAPLPYL